MSRLIDTIEAINFRWMAIDLDLECDLHLKSPDTRSANKFNNTNWCHPRKQIAFLNYQQRFGAKNSNVLLLEQEKKNTSCITYKISWDLKEMIDSLVSLIDQRKRHQFFHKKYFAKTLHRKLRKLIGLILLVNLLNYNNKNFTYSRTIYNRVSTLIDFSLILMPLFFYRYH